MQSLAHFLSSHAVALSKSTFWLLGGAVVVGAWYGVISPVLSLVLGVLYALGVTEHPYRHRSSRAATRLLQVCVIGLGFGIDISQVLHTGTISILFTTIVVISALALGLLTGYILRIQPTVSQLITVGTAICGGTAIATVAPTLDAQQDDIVVALGTIFILNALSLVLFPMLGSTLGLTQYQFGLWAAVAIHDTSSVVGAASRYGSEALSVATTAKLARTLWLIPVAFTIALWQHFAHRRNASAAWNASTSSIQPPYFIALFLTASAIHSFIPNTHHITSAIVSLAKVGLVLTLFFIGAGLSRTMLAHIDIKPLIQGTLLWIVIACSSLLAILYLTT
ncbi:MAG: putative sulfate exporter family transporter [Bacteroidota bacterium]|nr:putative sulfate exporter family transporter [Candidatus Kapabacteria bacterium]MDW8219831.1 putative sulfate exporter family transporter [Bacteroidota bacterium]